MAPPAAITAILAWQWRGYQLDDGLIYLRYIRNLFSGQGLVYNAGELFNGLTSPLYTFLLAVSTLVFRDPQVAAIILSATGLFAAACLGARLFSSSPLQAAFASSMVAGTGYFYYTFGMETSLLLALVAGSLLLARARSPWLFPVAALAISTRNEAVFLAVPAGLYYLYGTRRLPRAPYLIGAVAVFLAPYLFNWAYYGALLPGTAAAKFGQGASGYWGESLAFLQTGYLLNLVFSGSQYAFISMTLFCVAGIALLWRRAIARLSVAYLIGLGAFYLSVNMPNYHWYYAPFIFFLVLFSSFAICATIGSALSAIRMRSGTAAVLSGALIISAVLSVPQMANVAGVGHDERYAALGTWLDVNTAPGSSVALAEVGTVGWYSKRTVIDILGLVNDHNAAYIAHRDPYSWLYWYQPDYLICHQPEWPFEAACGLLSGAGLYRPVAQLNSPGLSLLERVPGVTDEAVVQAVSDLRPR
jgi:hypothetical protein